MDQAAAQFTGILADVRRVAHTAVINEDNVDTGKIYVKRPKPHDLRMLIDFQQPDPKQAEISDSKVQVYYPKIQTVQIFELGKSKSLVDQYLLLGFGTSSKELQASYTISSGGSDTINGV